MANFSSFFPTAAAGGGGFSNMKKISTLRSSEANHKVAFATTLNISGDVLNNYTTLSGRPTTSADREFFTAEDSYVGMTFVETGQTHTVTASTAHSAGSYATLTFTPAMTTGVIANNENIDFASAAQTINPASDLGLSDGDSIGYFLVGAGNSNNASTEKGGAGGNILQGTTIISNASTDLVITPGAVTGTNAAGPASTITGGLTLTSADGMPGGWGAFGTSTRAASAWSGVNGYSLGGGQHNEGGAGGVIASNGDGFGWGSYNSGVRAADGAVLLFY
jgi:hypothetical protein